MKNNYKLLYSIATRYYHTNNLEAAKILYEELVLEGVIPEFKSTLIGGMSYDRNE